MLEKLEAIKIKFEQLNQEVSDPSVVSNQQRYAKVSKERASIEPIVEKYAEYVDVVGQIEDNRLLLDDTLEAEFREMVQDDLDDLALKKADIEDALRVLLLPRDPNDDKNVIVEIRAGVGGDEAALFAGDLLRMYLRYAERKRWKVELLATNEIGIGGYKEAVFLIAGSGAYSRLKYESGTHRVQRVPLTESSGRIHTSASTVAVLPEAEDVEVEINQNDIRVDVFRSSGNGGQSVNTTDSAVRITHMPTGIVISCQDEKSQLKNKEKAMKILKAKLFELEQKKQDDLIAKDRKSQVGSGDRSGRVRTYNFPQGRVTDHRVNITLYKLDEFMDGAIEEMIDALATADQAEKIAMVE
ncbi:MAG: peptide chain release factor 1 [Eubacteriaceae bacterium]|nr:peptide chain release factor 1 [Eubacteriaceae bacterium]